MLRVGGGEAEAIRWRTQAFIQVVRRAAVGRVERSGRLWGLRVENM